MADAFVDFEWSRDPLGKGFELLEAHTVKRAPPKMVEERFGDWIQMVPEGRTSLFNAVLGDVEERPAKIVWRGKHLQTYRPLDHFPGLPVAFSSIRTPDDAVKFTNKFGSLWQREPKRGKDGDDVAEILRLAKVTLEFLDTFSEQGASGLMKRFSLRLPLSAELVPHIASGGVRLRYTVRTLEDAIFLKLAMDLSGGAIVRLCEECTNPFQAGPGSMPKRRFDAKYCSDDCQKNFNSKERTRRKHQ